MFSSGLNSQSMKRGIHPHNSNQKVGQSRHSRSKIEVTYIQQNPNSVERSRYNSNAPPMRPEQSAHMEQSRTRHAIFQPVPQQSQQEYNNRLYNLMKEQIDIASYNFREKMTQTIKQQAKEIQKLTSVVSHNDKVIRVQQEVIGKMNRNQDFMTSTAMSRLQVTSDLRSTSKSPRKISLTQNRSVKKLNNLPRVSPHKAEESQVDTLNMRVSALRTNIEELDEKIWMHSNRYKDVVFRVNEVEKMIGGQMWRRIKRCEQIVEKYLQSRANDQRQSSPTSPKIGDQRLNNLSEEMRELKELMFHLVNRQFSYDSYQLEKLKESFKSISKKVDQMGRHPEANPHNPHTTFKKAKQKITK